MKDTGGPAFPELGNVGYNSDWHSENGMTLRDYFAAAALTGLCNSDRYGNMSDEAVARYAYTNADAMLAERGKP